MITDGLGEEDDHHHFISAQQVGINILDLDQGIINVCENGIRQDLLRS